MKFIKNGLLALGLILVLFALWQFGVVGDPKFLQYTVAGRYAFYLSFLTTFLTGMLLTTLSWGIGWKQRASIAEEKAALLQQQVGSAATML